MEIAEIEEDQLPKRVKTDVTVESRRVEEDRISLLPDCLIIEILSRLPSTKYAIRTSSLSKRWTYLWGSVPSLILHENKSDEDFLVLEDELFFINSYYTKIELDCCIFNPSGPISWKNLRSLYISFGKLDENLIHNILSGSPLLETMNLHQCYGFMRLDVTSKSVKNLVLSGYRDPRSNIHAHSIEINAPNILSLLIQDCLHLWKLELLNVSSLLKVELNYTQRGHDYENTQIEIKNDEILEGILLSLGHVKQIKIGISCYEAIFDLEAEGFKSPSNLKIDDSPQLALWSD